MDIYDFFNSQDVAVHCQCLGHTLNGLECAVFIDTSRKHTLKEKTAAYKEIIAAYPDIEVPGEYDRPRVTSLHQALELIIEYENHPLDELLTPTPEAIYHTTLFYDNNRYRSADEGMIFRTYEETLLHALKISGKNKDEEDEVFECYKDPRTIEITKTHLGGKGELKADLTPDGEILYVYSYGPDIAEDMDAWSASLYCEAYNLIRSCYFDVPVPFKKGDIVEICNSWNRRPYKEVAFVLKEICRGDPQQHAKLLRHGTSFDMKAEGYHTRDVLGYECGLSLDAIGFYPDLQYCRQELEGEDRILKYLGLYMQEKIDVYSLLEIQKYLMLEKAPCNQDKQEKTKAIMERIDNLAYLDELPF